MLNGFMRVASTLITLVTSFIASSLWAEESRPASWIIQQDPEAYTLQLITLSSRSALDAFIGGPVTNAGIAEELASYRTQRNDKLLFVLIAGRFASVAEAEAAQKRLPPALQETTPLIRQVRSVQKELRRTLQDR